MNSIWETVRALHAHFTNTLPHIVDLIAVQEILRLYAEGLCASTISQVLKLPIDVIEKDLLQYYSTAYTKREVDLPFNPYLFWKDSSDLDEYIEKTFLFGNEPELIDTFLVCKQYDKYVKELENYD